MVFKAPISSANCQLQCSKGFCWHAVLQVIISQLIICLLVFIYCKITQWMWECEVRNIVVGNRNEVIIDWVSQQSAPLISRRVKEVQYSSESNSSVQSRPRHSYRGVRGRSQSHLRRQCTGDLAAAVSVHAGERCHTAHGSSQDWRGAAVPGSASAVRSTDNTTITHTHKHFYSAPHWKHCTSYGNSVRLSVCHTPVLCQNDGTQHDAVCTDR